MIWMEPLKNIYDKNSSNIPENGLCPIYFVRKKVAIIISITEDGDFVTAVNPSTDKKNNIVKALIPATEKSAARKNGVFPHAVFDNLFYIAGDYKDYFSDNSLKFEAYEENLKKLTENENCPIYIKSIYKYISKKSLISDLISVNTEGIVDKKTGELKTDKKGTDTAISSSCVIVFKVLLKDDSNPEIWNRKDFISFYQGFCRKEISLKEKEFDIITGEYTYCSKNMPMEICYEGDMTKLIGNDCPVSMGYESTMKAFNALRWCFELQRNAAVDTYHCALFDTAENKSINVLDYFDTCSEESTEELKGVIKEAVIDGNKINNLSNGDTVYFIAVDSDSKGRSALCGFEQLSRSDFLSNLDYWQNTMFGINTKTGEHYTPNLFSLISYSFGRNKKKTDNNPPYPNNALKKKYFKQLLNSVIFKKPLSKDFVTAIVNKVNKPQSFECYEDFTKYLRYAEMIIRKYKFDTKGDVSLTLDIENTDRSYLFGRLLAVAEYIEKSAVDNSKHVPAAMRLWTRFRQDPTNTWLRIRDKISPYLIRIKSKAPQKYIYCDAMLTDIENLFEADDMKKSVPLDPMYILGYTHQKQYIYTKKDSSETENEEL